MSSARVAAALAMFLCLGTPARGADAATAVSWPHNDLEKLLVAATNDPKQRGEFLRAALTSGLCALTDRKVPDDLARTDPKMAFPILGVKAADGAPATPVFTAPERAAETFGGSSFVLCLPGGVLLNKLRGQRVVLDPGEPYSVWWTADEIDHLLGVERTASIVGVQFTVPDRKPDALVAHLIKALGAIPEVKGAWLALAYWPEQKEWAWFLEIHTAAEHKPIEDVIDRAIQNTDMGGKAMDTSFLPPDAPPGKGIELLRR